MDQLATPTSHWRTLCRARRIDPAEVEKVASRYLAYRDYMGPRDGGLSLEAWFRFYHQEQESESGAQTGGVVGGCSATGAAVEQNCLTDPGGFLEILREHVTSLRPA